MEDIKTGKVYLKPNVVPEPLFDSWYAWSHLVSPVTAAMNIKERHLKIMNSYIQAPQIHAAAVKNPKMLGGPFMDYSSNRVEDVKKLRDNTLQKQGRMIEFADAVKQLDALLIKNAKGHSLEELYKQVPEILRGYVELVYDLNNQPAIRFFESLIYMSEFYDESNQSVALWLTDNDERPFVLSTPRLDDRDVLRLALPFSHKGWDELFKMQKAPQTFDYIKTQLGIRPEQEGLFSTFFTTSEPKPYRKYEGNGIRTRYFGHACILVETGDVSLLTDPVISYYGYNQEINRYTHADLPDQIDYVLITHNHQDHILFETMLQIRHKVKNIIVPRSGKGMLQDPSVKLMLKNAGFDNVIEMDEMESIRFGNVTITALPFIGEHSDLDIRSKLGFHVAVNDYRLMFLADSCNVEPKVYDHVHKAIGNVDVLFLGMECDGAPLSWLYGPLLTVPLSRENDFSRRLKGSNYEEGISLVDRFDPQHVYVYAMGQEPWLNYIMSIKYTPESNPIVQSTKLIDECKKRGKEAQRLFGEKEIVHELEGSLD